MHYPLLLRLWELELAGKGLQIDITRWGMEDMKTRYGDCSIVLYASITAFQESVKNILSPETQVVFRCLADNSQADCCKATARKDVKSVGTKINSESLIASGSDALFVPLSRFQRW